MARNIKSWVEIALVASAGVGAAIISTLDLFGLLDHIPFLKDKQPSLGLLLIGILTSYLVLERRSKLDKFDHNIATASRNIAILNGQLLEMKEAIERANATIANEFSSVARNLGESIEGLKTHLDFVGARIGDLAEHGAEFFSTTDELLDRLSEVTVGAEIVATLNLSPPRGSSDALDNYFDKVGAYIKNSTSKLRSFRTLAYIDSVAKAKWILQRATDSLSSGRLSTGLFVQAEGSLVLLGFQLVIKKGQYYCFIYPPVSPSGNMSGFLFRDQRVGELLVQYFDNAWATCPKLNEGKHVTLAGLELLKRFYPVLQSEVSFQSLQEANSRQTLQRQR